MKRPSQHADESAIEFLRRSVSWLDAENERYLQDLPTTEALLEFFDLWHVYDTDFWEGILACIAEGDDPEPARQFIRKWKLGRDWLREVSDAAKLAKAPA